MNIRTLYTAMAVATALPMTAASAVTFFDPVAGPIPQTLTDLGIYTNISAKTTDPSLKYFDVNAALWSDGAAKDRWIVLPTGTSVVYNDETDVFDYPQGAMFVKNFYLDSVAGDPSTRRYWETRILVNKHEGGFDKWHGFTYKWNKAQDEATLVSILNGLDTTFTYYPNGLSKSASYKKWRFPSQEQCIECHKQGTNDLGAGTYTARGVLGFLPAQLKRTAPKQAGINQITWLFNQGVFSGTQPTTAQLAKRWKGLSEPIPTTLSADERFKVIDSMARSYIAANCSGCHSQRNSSIVGSPPEVLNYDWHTLTPKLEFGTMTMGTLTIENSESLTGPLPDFDGSHGHRKYVESVKRAGMADKPFWSNVALPNVAQLPNGLALVQRGYPYASVFLYRQFGMRRPAWRDSLSMQHRLAGSDPTNMKSWLFVNPWGSMAWRADLAAHGVKVDSLLGAHGLFSPELNNPMPLLATNLPDTAAMRVLGEWTANYRTLVEVEGQGTVSLVDGKQVFHRAEMPRLNNRLLVVPNGWTGKAQMFTVSGRAYTLPSVGRGQYAIPQAAPVGVYLFRVGNHTFRASVLK